MSRLDPADEAFLVSHSRAYMFVRDAEGGVRGWPMTARYAGGICVMTTYRTSPKMKHVGAASRMTLVMTHWVDDLPAEYAVVEGGLRLTPIDASNAEEVIARMLVDDAPENVHFRRHLFEGKRVLLEVLVERLERFRLDPATPVRLETGGAR